MSSILDSLAAHPCCEVLRQPDVDDFLVRHSHALLFFTGNVAQRREGLDVAVVVRELAAGHGDQLGVGLIDGRDEAAIMVRFGVVVTPAVVFVRDGQTVELITRMRDWPVYADACTRLLAQDQASTTAGTGATA